MARLSPLALALFAVAACGGGDGARETRDSSPPTPIAIVDFEGLEAALAARHEGGLLLNFWAIWCPPCVAELPELGEVAKAYRERGGAVLGVSFDLMVAGADQDSIEGTVREFLEERDLDFPVLIYDADDYDAINARFDLPGAIPVTLAIDAEGRVVDRQEGMTDKKRFEAMMRKAMGL